MGRKMSNWLKGIGLTLAGLLALAPVAGADDNVKTEYTRITSGGGQSKTERFEVQDSLSREPSAVTQKGAGVQVTSLRKETEQTTSADNWEDYK